MAKALSSWLKQLSLAAFFTGFCVNSEAKPVVLSSIKPLSLIVQEVVGDKAQVETLLPLSASPHDYPMRPSDYQRLRQADLVVWVGADLESFLHKPLANLNAERIVTTSQIQGLFWPPLEAAEAAEHHHERDPHLWLDPRNANLVAQNLVAKLAQIDPSNAKIYRANALIFAAKMKDLDANIAEKMQKLSGRGFAVYHEGYAHFVAHYGLKQLEFVTFTPEQKPGARHLHQLREVLAKEGRCLFLEPYNDSSLALGIAKDLHLKTATLDALGALSVDTYSELLGNLAEAFSACLADGH